MKKVIDEKVRKNVALSLVRRIYTLLNGFTIDKNNILRHKK